MQTTRVLLGATLLSSFFVAELAWKPATASAGGTLGVLADTTPESPEWVSDTQWIEVDGEWYWADRSVDWDYDAGDYAMGDGRFESNAPNYEMIALYATCGDGSTPFMDGAYGIRGANALDAEIECPTDWSVVAIWATFDYNCRDLSRSELPNCEPEPGA
jgi:hypothetical protein